MKIISVISLAGLLLNPLNCFSSQELKILNISENQGILYRSTGTLEQPLRTIESGNYLPEVWDKGGHEMQGIWLMGIYKMGENELLVCTHNESCYEEEKPCNSETKYFSLGVGYSQDNGKTWQYCGDMTRTPRYGKEGDVNIKGVPNILKDDYFYIYFREFPEKNLFYPAVARAIIADVVEAARNGKMSIGRRITTENGMRTDSPAGPRI